MKNPVPQAGLLENGKLYRTEFEALGAEVRLDLRKTPKVESHLI